MYYEFDGGYRINFEGAEERTIKDLQNRNFVLKLYKTTLDKVHKEDADYERGWMLTKHPCGERKFTPPWWLI